MRRIAQADGMQLHQYQIAQQAFRQVSILPQWKRDIVEDCQIRKQGALLKQHAHFATHGVHRIIIERVDHFAVNLDVTDLRTQLPTNQTQDRCLARSRPAHHGNHFPAWKIHLESRQNRALSIIEVQIANFNKIGHGGMCC